MFSDSSHYISISSIRFNYKKAFFLFLVVSFIFLITACADKSDEKDSTASDSTDSQQAYNMLSLSEATELSEITKNAEKAIQALSAKTDDILIACNNETMAACCFTVKGNTPILMYDGDYQGSYDRLEYINEREYGDWTIFLYRIDPSAKAPVPTEEITTLANRIYIDYINTYGELAEKSFVFVIDSDKTEYQFLINEKGHLIPLGYDDEDYDLWKDSQLSDNYWAKLTCDEDENGNAWAVYEYDEQCTEAFYTIAEAYNVILDSGLEIENGTLLVLQDGSNQTIMEYEDGSMLYLQAKIFDSMKDNLVEIDLSAVKDLPITIKAYTVK